MKGGLLLSLLKSLPRLKFGRHATALAVVGTVVASSLVGGGVVLVAATSAEAYAPSASATCSVLSVNLQGYQDIVPEKPAVPGTPGQAAIPPTYETIVVPEIPAIPPVPATYVQEFLYVQHQTGNTKWMPEGWNGIVNGVDNGKGWAYVQPLQSRDSTEELTPFIPGVPAVPATTKQGEMIDPGQPEIAPTEGQPAVPAKVNTVTVTIDGVVVEDGTFGGSFAKTYNFGDETITHTWHVQAVAWNDSQLNVDQSGTTTHCVTPPTVIDTIVAPPAANPATCEADGSLPSLPTFDDYTFAWDRAFDGPGTYIASASANPGKIFKADLKTSFDVIVQAKLSGGPCVVVPPITVIATQPLPPTFNDVCGTVGDRTDGPLDTEEYTYSKTVEGDKVTVKVTPRDQYTHFAERDSHGNVIVTEWAHTFTNEPCPTETQKPTPSVTQAPTATQQPTPTTSQPAVVVPQGVSTPTTKAVTTVAAKNVLAYTGINPVLPIVGLALVVLLIGLGMMFASHRRRHRTH